jgi:regulator of sirC expression with transglutaminase-like and TPR domain
MDVSAWTDRAAIEAWIAAAGAGADEEIDLAKAALALAALDAERFSARRHAAHLDEMAAALAAAAAGVGRPLAARADAIAAVLFGRFGYVGDRDTYDDLANADLMRVIDRRRGLPIALSILYLHLARGQGWAAEGVNFPGHFLVRLVDGREGRIVDPFHGGAAVGRDDLARLVKDVLGPETRLSAEHLAPASNRDILLRLLNNAKGRLLRAGDQAKAATVLDRMLLVAPRAPALWHEAATLNAELGRLQRALACVDALAKLDRGGRLKAEIATLRRALNVRLN